MKRIFILFLALPLMFGACKKGEDVKPYTELEISPKLPYVMEINKRYFDDICEYSCIKRFKMVNLDTSNILTIYNEELNHNLGIFEITKEESAFIVFHLGYKDNKPIFKENEEYHLKSRIMTKDNKIFIFEHKFKLKIKE